MSKAPLAKKYIGKDFAAVPFGFITGGIAGNLQKGMRLCLEIYRKSFPLNW